MSKVAIRAVLFDYGGVIAEEGFYNGLVELAKEQSLDVHSMPEQGMKAVYDSGFVLGHGTAADFWALLRKRTGLEGNDYFLTDKIINGFQIRHWLIELVRRLRFKGYVVGILSDQTYWLNELDKRDHFFIEFDHIYNSYYLGKGKRDPSLFTDVVNDLKLRPGEVLFIDDSEKNVQTARKMGLRAILYVDHEGFLSELEDILKQEIEH
jgi:putative hydrolase of the HAD superfamily